MPNPSFDAETGGWLEWVEPCEHGKLYPHRFEVPVAYKGTPSDGIRDCPGGVRRRVKPTTPISHFEAELISVISQAEQSVNRMKGILAELQILRQQEGLIVKPGDTE